MALPLNVYQKVVGIASTSPGIIYTAPIGYTGVILMGQVANIGSTTERVLFSYLTTSTSTTTEIVPNSPVSGNDVIKLFSGKLFVLSGESLKISGTNGSNLKYTFSILETLN
jgi:hypothetical protein